MIQTNNYPPNMYICVYIYRYMCVCKYTTYYMHTYIGAEYLNVEKNTCYTVNIHKLNKRNIT